MNYKLVLPLALAGFAAPALAQGNWYGAEYVFGDYSRFRLKLLSFLTCLQPKLQL